MVAATVVEPVAPRDTAIARSARESFKVSLVCASDSRVFASRPMCSEPSMTAMVAGTAPASRTAASTAVAVWKFCGQGMPCVTMVLSSATTGRLLLSAVLTSGLICKTGFTLFTLGSLSGGRRLNLRSRQPRSVTGRHGRRQWWRLQVHHRHR